MFVSILQCNTWILRNVTVSFDFYLRLDYISILAENVLGRLIIHHGLIIAEQRLVFRIGTAGIVSFG